jgi:hypothetical protein
LGLASILHTGSVEHISVDERTASFVYRLIKLTSVVNKGNECTAQVNICLHFGQFVISAEAAKK